MWTLSVFCKSAGRGRKVTQFTPSLAPPGPAGRAYHGVPRSHLSAFSPGPTLATARWGLRGPPVSLGTSKSKSREGRRGGFPSISRPYFYLYPTPSPTPPRAHTPTGPLGRARTTAPLLPSGKPVDNPQLFKRPLRAHPELRLLGGRCWFLLTCSVPGTVPSSTPCLPIPGPPVLLLLPPSVAGGLTSSPCPPGCQSSVALGPTRSAHSFW